MPHVAVAPDARRRILLVHAHPDDETISSGVTMARYVAEGAHVTLLTCTLGEEGEVLDPEVERLAAHLDDQLGPHREKELAAAMAILGVSDHRFLGGAGRWRDSGMMGEPTNDRPEAFWRADLTEAAAEVAAVIREVRPQVLVTYDTNGEYGHPDHIQAHRAATYGSVLAAVGAFRPDLGEPWDVPKVYWTAVPRSVLQQGIDAMTAAGQSGFFGVDRAEEFEFAVDDALVTTRLDGMPYEPAKIEALRAHRSQVDPAGPFFQLAEAAGPEAWGHEYYMLVKGPLGSSRDADGRETDLFDGVA